MINISELVYDTDFAAPYILLRPAGAWVSDGVWDVTTTGIARVGVIQPGTTQDAVQFLPEGQRSVRILRVWDREEVRAGEEPDRITWDSRLYRVAFAKLWYPHGYYFAVATEYKDGE